MTKIPSGSKILDKMLNGGYEKDIITTIYGPTDSVDILFIFTTTANRNNDGTVIYNTDGTADMVTMFTIETQIHF